ncbi:ureidoglycolate lyase [Bacillus sp. JJ1532]|uniref:ureidoglycolate lyase n=1 Tax=Bacillus sp. JJ1532 TaxID=3122958 RepID=UPI002FFEFBC5
MDIKAIPVSKIDFSKYGTYYNMNQSSDNLWSSQGDGWSDIRTKAPIISSAGSLGITQGSPIPCKVSKMERHLHTQEALLCLTDPIVIAIASGGEDKQPLASNIEAVIIQPGEVIVLNKGIWHDACHGINKSVRYYWLAEEYEGEPTEWAEIIGGPIELHA